jgi:transposase
MTETIYTMGERHPQSTKPMKKGRPMSSGKYATAVFDRCFNRGWSARHIARVVGLSASTVSNIINRWKEKQNGTKDN